ncbi:MAG: FKBP-type peptidyl-prolyl cis-trans isomerase [Treponema sp.]|nr:FKBP-type peptidyl-prolyl cis-trans isomerase [Treponema sp.]MCL2250410.1 FKBP-type peptidyl-prolyl cis-trans isomerase [Treponema sp.]
MTTKHWLILALFTAVFFMGCKGAAGGSSSGKVNFDRDASYSLGLNIGATLKEGMTADNLSPNIDEFLKGIKDGITGKKPRFDLDEARQKIEQAFNSLEEIKNTEAVKLGNEFLAENAKKPGVIITNSGLQYEVLAEGYGPSPTMEDMVVVHYEGKFIDGKFFDSSYTYGQPARFDLDYIIPGWAEGLQLMKIGSKYRFVIPSELGYGEEGMQDWNTGRQLIPPFATLIFEVELLEINPIEEE